ncbi:MAG: MraZ protein [Rickettsiales bacterium]|jgi:MraZ protein
MALFLSTFENRIDKKGRVSVPAQFRASLANQDFAGIIIYESFVNDCIEGCDIARIKHLSDSIDNLDPFSENRDSFATTILGGAIQLSFDGDGRVVLPEKLIKKIGLKETVVFIGKGSTFEIWEPIKFSKYLDKAKTSAKDNRGQLKLVNKG